LGCNQFATAACDEARRRTRRPAPAGIMPDTLSPRPRSASSWPRATPSTHGRHPDYGCL